MVDQNKFTCSYSFDKVNPQNQGWKLNDATSSIGFIYRLADGHEEAWWHERISTPFFGEIERIRLFAHILNHNSHHAGQISLTLARHQ